MELLERASFLRTLAEYAAEARQGDGRLVLVSGESGMGKTALVEAFQGDLSGARWLWGVCDGLFTPRPLGPLFDIGAQTEGELAGLCRDGAPRDRLFAALLAEMSSPDFTVTVIEDAHWADEATIDLISFAGRRLARLRGLMLVTYRDDELGDDHPLRRVLGDLATQRATRRIKLPPLSVAAVRTLAGQHPVDVAELHRVTGGNPFYVSEILEAGWPSVPPTVRDAVAARLTRLSSGTRHAVEAAAVIGTRVPREQITMLASEPAAVADCLAASLLVPEGSGLRFRHELVRMAVEAAIPAQRKAALHARLLAGLECDTDADPAVLAHHAAAAGDQEAVRRHAPAAARRAAALGAHREAAAHYEHALACTDQLTPADRAALQEALAGEYSLLDRWTESEQVLQSALAIQRDFGDALSVGRLLRQLSTALWRLCRGEESERAVYEAVAVLETRPPGRELAWAYARRGVAASIAGRTGEGYDFYERARTLGERLRQPDVVSYALNAIGFSLAEEGKDGTAELELALQTALDAGIQQAAGLVYTSLQESAVMLHRFEDADHYFAAGTAYCEDRELGVYATCLLGWRAWGLLLRGRWDEALALTARSLGLPGISPVNRLNPLRVEGAIRARRGDALGWEMLDDAIGLAESLADAAWITPIRALRAELAWTHGDADLAALEILACRDYLHGHLDPWTIWSAAIWLVRLTGAAELPPDPPEPYALELAGDWRAAAIAWERLARPYDAALVRMVRGDESGLRLALATCDELAARAGATAVRRRMKETGVQTIPRGPRAATRSAPAGLTVREQEVLALLSEGLPDKEISRALVISERTVHHHVSAVLSKIGVSSRAAAVREAARRGIGSPT
jgi:DNA-binding CsgD family transcriptional regulator/tetratricopeptide (TPR) repeat protein